MSTHLLAVYGRLRAEPRPLLENCPAKGTHNRTGWKLYECQDDAYAWPDPDSRITVTVFEVDQFLLERLDARAGTPHRFKRINVPPGLWLYISGGSSILEYPEVVNGDWLEHLKTKEDQGG